MDQEEFVRVPIESINRLLECNVRKLHEIWVKMYGPDAPKLLEMREQLINYYSDFSNEILESQVKKMNNTVNEIGNLIDERDSLIMALEIHANSINTVLPGEMPLQEKKIKLLNEIQHMRETKNQNWESYKILKEKIISLCDRLGEDGETQIILIEEPRIPLERDIFTLQNLLDNKLDIINDRLGSLNNFKKQLNNHLELLEKTNEQHFLNSTSEGDWDLSLRYIQLIQAEVLELQILLDNRKTEKAKLIEELQDIWDKIYMEDDLRSQFIKNHNLYGDNTLKAIRNEIKRCEIRRKELIHPLIEKCRSDIRLQCQTMGRFVDPDMVQIMEAEDFSEAVLTTLESYIATLVKEFKDYSELFGAIKERENLWKAWVECELLSLDPDRFHKTRGNELQKQLRTRQSLEKKLPIIEKTIADQCDVYFKNNNKPFLWFGQRLDEIFDYQFKELEELKEVTRQSFKENKICKGKGPIKTPKKGGKHHLLQGMPGASLSTQSPVSQVGTPINKIEPSPLPLGTASSISSLASYSDFVSPSRTPVRRPLEALKINGGNSSKVPAAHSSPLPDIVVLSPDTPSVIVITSDSDV